MTRKTQRIKGVFSRNCPLLAKEAAKLKSLRNKRAKAHGIAADAKLAYYAGRTFAKAKPGTPKLIGAYHPTKGWRRAA